MAKTESQTTYTLTGTRIRETEKAVRFSYIKVNDTVVTRTAEWFPLSQVVKSFHDPHTADVDTITIPEWLAEKNGVTHALGQAPRVVGANPNLAASYGTEKSETHLSHSGAFDSYDDDIPF